MCRLVESDGCDIYRFVTGSHPLTPVNREDRSFPRVVLGYRLTFISQPIPKMLLSMRPIVTTFDLMSGRENAFCLKDITVVVTRYGQGNKNIGCPTNGLSSTQFNNRNVKGSKLHHLISTLNYCLNVNKLICTVIVEWYPRGIQISLHV